MSSCRRRGLNRERLDDAESLLASLESKHGSTEEKDTDDDDVESVATKNWAPKRRDAPRMGVEFGRDFEWVLKEKSMRTHSKPTLLVLLLGILFFSSPVFGQEEEKAKAKKHFEAGKNLMKVDEYDDASEHFKKSVKIFPTKAAMLNLANCYMALHDFHHALNWYQRLKFKYKKSLGEDLLEVVNEHIREIKSMSVKLKIKVKQNGATVKVDGRDMGVSPLTSYIIVAPGEHSVEVSLSGHKVFRGKPKAVLGAQTVLEIDLPRLGAQKPAPESVAQVAPVTRPPIEQEKRKKRRKRLSPVPFIMTTGATIAAGISWIGVDTKVTSIYNVEKENQTDALKERAEKLQKADGALLGFTIGGVVASFVVFLFTDFKKGSEQKTPDDDADFKLGSIAPVVMNRGGGVAMGGSF